MRTVRLDGLTGDWLALLVAAPTGVTYTTWYGGEVERDGALEGYLVPLRAPAVQAVLRRLFEQTFGGTGTWGFAWPEVHLTTLSEALAGISLELDRDRLDQADEAWVPVVGPDGSGILTWANSR